MLHAGCSAWHVAARALSGDVTSDQVRCAAVAPTATQSHVATGRLA